MSSTSAAIDDYLAKLPMWQRDNLDNFRRVVHEAVPAIEEDWKWNVPIFSLAGKPLFAMAAFKEHTKYNFIRNGAFLEDRDGLFNNGFESKTSRGIDLRENESVDGSKLAGLIKESANYNKA